MVLQSTYIHSNSILIIKIKLIVKDLFQDLSNVTKYPNEISFFIYLFISAMLISWKYIRGATIKQNIFISELKKSYCKIWVVL